MSETLFDITQSLSVKQTYNYIEWDVKDASGKKVASVTGSLNAPVRCLTCDRKMVGSGAGCVHVQAVKRSLGA